MTTINDRTFSDETIQLIDLWSTGQPNWATILHVHENYIILDGWNCGTKSGSVAFNTLTDIRFFLAGKWGVKVDNVEYVQ